MARRESLRGVCTSVRVVLSRAGHSPLLYHWQQRFSFEKRLLFVLMVVGRRADVCSDRAVGFCSTPVPGNMLVSKQGVPPIDASPCYTRQSMGFVLSPRSWLRSSPPSPRSPRSPRAHGTALSAKASADAEQVGTLVRELRTDPPEELRVELRSLDSRRRLITGSLNVFAPKAHVWTVLTAFDEMIEFVPHMLSSRFDTESRLLEQVAWVSRRLRLQSRLVMEVEMLPEQGELLFSKRESRDFASWKGVYRIVPRSETETRLEYALDVVPMILFPIALVERKIMKEVPGVLRAFAARAEQRWNDEKRETIPGT